MLLQLQTLIFTFILLLFISTKSLAAPQVKLCLDESCKSPLKIEITEACWSDVKEIFSPPFPTDKDEQDNIVNSIALIQTDIFNSVFKHNPDGNSASDLYTGNSRKNNYKNIKSILGILLDNYLINRHFLRKSITKRSWNGFESEILLLQSLTDSKLYTLETNNNELGASAIIQTYNKKSSGIEIKNTTIKEDSNQIDNDFE
ncbi:MAG: hypothetical protein DIZ80_07570 [endosymbiont of Galathealinum brachiosum]|uniref:Uncharacterized protein n=1 Tax=endosymbiont of Galathealinum brachiosum TaxID=2200906 RepID=A0A370DHZ9_9GAMM|nr:MAG: hypothetical protein DIZ80_07570 [endosymbiont of Galathealinum brachiosum]